MSINMKCPHCLVKICAQEKSIPLGKDSEGDWGIKACLCPNEDCGKWIIWLQKSVPDAKGPAGGSSTHRITHIQVYPKGINRPPAPQEVPREAAEDYNEACLVLSDSPKASAALSRRCLQNILRETANVKPGNLYSEIQEVIDSNTLPSHLAGNLDMVRVTGNFAAHPEKSEKTGEIVPVEPEEAEWNLDVLEGLFDFYFVQQERSRRKKQALNKKLREVGKKELR